jgi:hypothetical protein
MPHQPLEALYALLVPFEARIVALVGPAPVSIHYYGNML